MKATGRVAKDILTEPVGPGGSAEPWMPREADLEMDPKERARKLTDPLRAIGVAAAPFEAGLGTVVGAPTEIVSRKLGASPETAKTIGTVAELAAPFGPGAYRLGKKAVSRILPKAPVAEAAAAVPKKPVVDLTEDMLIKGGETAQPPPTIGGLPALNVAQEQAPRLASFTKGPGGIGFIAFERGTGKVTVDDIKSMFPGRELTVKELREGLRSDIQQFRIDAYDAQGRASSAVLNEMEKEIGGSFSQWNSVKPTGPKEPVPALSLTQAQSPTRGTAGGHPYVPKEAIGAETELGRPFLKEETSRRLANAAGEMLVAGKVARDPSKLISDQMVEIVANNQIADDALEAILKRNNLSFADLAHDAFRPAVTDAAKKMQALSAVTRRLNTLAARGGPEAQAEAEILSNMASEATLTGVLGDTWKRLNNVRRGLMVGQLATAMRNIESQGARVGLGTLDDAMQAGLGKILGTGSDKKLLDGFEVALKLVHRGTKGEVDALVKEFPFIESELFSRYSSDVGRRLASGAAPIKASDRIFSGVEKGVEFVNIVNRTQEFVFRRAIFAARVEQSLRKGGKSIEGLMAEEGGLRQIPLSTLKKAINDSLEYTFAGAPKSKWAKDVVSLVNRTPPLSLVMAFPRFMASSMRHLFEYSPAGFVKLLNPKELQAIANGDVKTLSRASLGALQLGVALQMRNSEQAGEKWYEYAGTDVRAFNPFAGYLFIADLIQRKERGTLNRITWQDVIQGLASTNLRAGTGLFLMDEVLNTAFGLTKREHGKERAKEFAGEVAGQFLVPLQTLQDVYAGLKGGEAQIVRESRGTGRSFTGPLQRRIPGLAEKLPAKASPTQAAPVKREEPLLRQLTGMTVISPKSPAQKELDRLDFAYQEIFPVSGNRDADQAFARALGPLVERSINPVVNSAGYRRLSDAGKAVVLSEAMERVRGIAKRVATAQNPMLFANVKFEQIPVRKRRLLEERGVKAPRP